MTHPIIADIMSDLKAHADDHTLQSGTRYFKEAIRLRGVTVPQTETIAKQYFAQIKTLPKSQIFKLCESLWQTGYFEDAIIACHWSYAVSDQYSPEDFAVFEKWVNQYVTNWATCDTLCNHSLGAFIERYPDYVDRLKQWTKSSNRWVKRAAAVSFILPARKGKFFPTIIEIADLLLTDPDDLVQKGYGWLLKAASQAHQQAVFQFVMTHKQNMPRTALRYAIEKMPTDLKAQAMAK